MPTPCLRLRTLSALLFSLLLTLATPLWAQKDAGAIVGLVRDPSGAVVTGAKVTVTDVDRGIQLTFSTNAEGQYVASPLRIGRYSVTVEKQGFRKAVAGPVQVNIQDRVGRGSDPSGGHGHGSRHGHRPTPAARNRNLRTGPGGGQPDASTRFL
jgi:hypothetical protein